jgi:transposase
MSVVMVLGIDIAKRSMDVILRKGSEVGEERLYQHFVNSEAGIAELLEWLASQQVSELQVCLEATNVYWEAVAEALHAAGYGVSVVNPQRIKGFAMSQMQRNKTDKVDAGVIASFCAALQPDPWQPPTATQSKLRALQRHRQALKQSILQHQNRLDTVKDGDVKGSLQRLLESLQAELQAVEQKLAEVSEACQEIREQKQLLLTIPGIGQKSAEMLLSLFYDITRYKDARAVAADAGVTPAHHESGERVHKRPHLSKLGKAAVRGELHMPALNAMRTNPPLRAFAQRLRQRGKPEPLIIAAVVRKLLHICYGVLKHKTPFDPEYGLRLSTA